VAVDELLNNPRQRHARVITMQSSTDDPIVVEPAGAADACVIWMHGLGADGNDFVPIVPELNLPAAARVRFVFPHAPHRPITINMGYVMRGWYDIYDLASLRREDASGIREAQAYVETLIGEQRGAGIAARRIVLAGFSQGAVMALHTGLRYAETLGGIVALSGYLPLGERLAAEAAAANQSTPVFLAHGTFDEIVPPHLGDRARDALQRAGYHVERHGYPMAHTVCAEEVADVGAFLRRVLA
jgi:phospholipase/carboxylesterase